MLKALENKVTLKVENDKERYGLPDFNKIMTDKSFHYCSLLEVSDREDIYNGVIKEYDNTHGNINDILDRYMINNYTDIDTKNLTLDTIKMVVEKLWKDYYIYDEVKKELYMYKQKEMFGNILLEGIKAIFSQDTFNITLKGISKALNEIDSDKLKDMIKIFIESNKLELPKK